MIKTPQGVYQFRELNFPNIIHGFSTVSMGSMSPYHPHGKDNLQVLAKRLDIPADHIVGTDQVHGNTIALVTQQDASQHISSTDGLLTAESDLFLYAVAADCVPVFLLDTKTQLLGVVHAGRRGVYSQIVKQAVKQMKEKGSRAEDILAGIGPSIRACCYDVTPAIAEEFEKKFGQQQRYIQKKDNKFFLDLHELLARQLGEEGILLDNIIDSGLCTKDMQQEFFSYRGRGGAKTNEVCAAIIGRYE